MSPNATSAPDPLVRATVLCRTAWLRGGWRRHAGTCAVTLVALAVGARSQAQSFEGRMYLQSQPGGYGQHFRFIDVDGDGRRDVLDGGDNGGNSYLYVMLDAGNGALRTAYSIDTFDTIIPSAFACGDIDGDGDRDILYARAFGRVGVLRAVGNGTFLPSPDLVVGEESYAIELADVDGDSDLDLLVAGYDGHLRVMLNLGSGSFVQGSLTAIGMQPLGMAVADIDGDGDVDVVTADSADGTVSVLLGVGNGTFSPRVIYAVGASPADTFLVDVDGDGDRDIVVANTGSANVSVLLNLGGGAFGPATSYATGLGCTHLDVADLDANGTPDLAVSNGHGSVSILLNTGSGSFGPFATFGTGSYDAIGALDVDRDGDLDLAVVGGVALLNDGHGAFSVPAHEPEANIYYPQIETQDLDGDGDLDVAMLSTYTLTTRMNLGGGSFSAPIRSPHPGLPNNIDLQLADLDGDGDVDAIESFTGSGYLVLQWNQGNGTMGPGVQLATGSSIYGFAVADLNGDGLADIVVRDGTQFLLATNLGAGSFMPFAAISPAGNDTTTWKPFDLDGDGNQDLITGGPSGIFFLPNTGGGVFGAPILLAPGSPLFWDLVVGDLDGDTDPDLVIETGAGTSVLRNTGGMSFGPPAVLGGTYGRIELVDVDHDGDPDIVCATNQNALVFDNLGSATFAAPTYVGLGGALDTATLDFDLDGDEDFVACTDQQFFLLENRTATGLAFCAGDGSATACPCGNASAPGSNVGCLNSGGRGGALVATGSTSLVSDTLRLHGAGMTNSAVLYFQGTAATNGGSGAVFGDGLRCVGGTVIRLDVEHNIGGASSSPGQGDPPLRELGNITAPGQRFYQAWYRDAQSFCTPVTFNLTSAVRIAWRP